MKTLLEHLRGRYPQSYSVCRQISCGMGWRQLIERASADLYALAERENVAVQIEAIREKYGLLQIWVTAPSSVVDAKAEEIACAAEKASETTCEYCGAPGTLREESGWLRVTCEKCG